MKRNLLRLMPLLLLGLWLGSGCVPPLYYKDMVAPVGYQGSGAVTVTVHDQREYIKDGKTEASYEGQVRATVGIPYHRNTVTGQPLATEMARGLAATLESRGFQTTVVGAAAADPFAEVVSRMKATGGVRGVYLAVEEWMYDGWGSYTLESKLNLKVLDAAGKVLAEAKSEMKENLGSHPMNPAKEAYRRALERLLNDPLVSKALAVAAAPPAETAPAPPPTPSEPPPVPAEDKKPAEAGEPPPVPAEDQKPATEPATEGTKPTPAPPAEG